MQRIWERSLDERHDAQTGKVRELIIGAYAPREPAAMEAVLRFLEFEKRYPLKAAHRVIDRLAAISIGTTVVTHQEVTAFIRGIPDDFAIAVGPCACRLHTAEAAGPDARDLKAGKLDFCRPSPLNVDIQIAKCGEAFGALPAYSRINKQELLALEEECFNHGLVANIYVVLGGEAGICHCSSATCAPFLANEALGGTSAVVRKGAFVATTDRAKCQAAGDCAKVCHFGARRLEQEGRRRRLTVDAARCYGCGLCAAVCRQGAIAMVPRRA